MKCPHCQVAFHEVYQTSQLGHDADGYWSVRHCTCPTCAKMIVELQNTGVLKDATGKVMPFGSPKARYLARPRSITRPAPPTDVPAKFAKDYIEAAAVLADSAQASAALSRRCLQHVLREKANVKPGDLASEIQQVLDEGKLPSHLADAIDAVRIVGNFAAHPIKSQHSGEVLPVEPGEAEWTLDVLDGLFDFYFVQPELLAKRREALNQKLDAAKKPPMKGGGN